jgi:hypothetical protein
MILIEHLPKTETLTEQTAEGKNLYIEGIFLQAEVKNRNGRVYPKSILESALDAYQRNFINESQAIGELNHPENRAQPDPAEACIIIESLSWHGNDIIGKAKVLNTPRGLVVKGLLEGGWRAGVSSRATGSVKLKEGTNFVQPDLVLYAVDVVNNPSAPDAYVKSLYEQNQNVTKYILEYIKSLKL